MVNGLFENMPASKHGEEQMVTNSIKILAVISRVRIAYWIYKLNIILMKISKLELIPLDKLPILVKHTAKKVERL